MFCKKMTKMTMLLLIAGLLVSAPAVAGPLAAPGSSFAGERTEEGFWAGAWSWLLSLWGEDSALACAGGGDRGMCIDPNGALACAGGGDSSMCIDPNG